MNKGLFALPILAAMVIASLGMASLNGSSPTATETKQGISMKGTFCWYLNDELLECSPNALTTIGENTLRDMIGAGGTTVAADWIALGNGTDPTAASTNLPAELNVSGMTRAQGTYAAVAGNGKILIF